MPLCVLSEKERLPLTEKKQSPPIACIEETKSAYPFEDPAKLKPSLNVADKPLEVIFMDENVLIINKPAGLLSQPASKEDDSVVNRALNLINKTKGGFIPTPAHRLDRNISGVMALALNPRSLRALTDMFRNRRVVKKYLAVVRRCLSGEGVIEAPLERDERSLKTVVNKGVGKRSATRYMSLSAGNHASLWHWSLLPEGPINLGFIYRTSGILSLAMLIRRRRQRTGRPMLHAYSLKFLGMI